LIFNEKLHKNYENLQKRGQMGRQTPLKIFRKWDFGWGFNPPSPGYATTTIHMGVAAVPIGAAAENF